MPSTILSFPVYQYIQMPDMPNADGIYMRVNPVRNNHAYGHVCNSRLTTATQSPANHAYAQPQSGIQFSAHRRQAT
jgi:hypothetical protein